MKKRALIIGSSGSGDSFLPGVERDINNLQEFLKSDLGGQWFKSEIVSLYNPTKLKLKEEIDKLKSLDLDFSFVFFSGHGEYSNRMKCRRLYLTSTDFIYETDILKIAPKQLTIIDSCAKEDDMILEDIMEKSAALESFSSHKKYRRIYESSIESCTPQAINLYSCDIDEYSQDTSKGGMYAANLIKIASSLSNNKIVSALEAHQATSELVSKKTHGEQNPQYLCTVKFGPKLPIAVH